MGYYEDFTDDSGWSAVDTNIRLLGPRGRKFINYLKENRVKTIIRYYASSQRAKTITNEEARHLSDEGFFLLPVYQDRHRLTVDFGSQNGVNCARNAVWFAGLIGQPEGSTILFAVDEDFSQANIDAYIVPYFESVNVILAGRFRIGAYGSGLVLSKLLEAGLIEIPWISMSRLFRGTRDFFYSDEWAMRQVPLPLTHGSSGTTYDKNVLKIPVERIGAFQVGADGEGALVVGAELDGTVGGGRDAGDGRTRVDRTNSYVSTEGLNFRETPNGNVIRSLTIGQPVVDLGEADVPGWRSVEIEGERGVVFGKYLREAAAPEIEALIASVIEQWVRFEKGRASETSDPYYKYVGEMWQSIGLNYDGRDTNQPWSAAFISFVVKRSGSAYAGFEAAASHSVFSNDAIQARYRGLTDRPFWGYRLREVRPDIGDIIHRNRGGNQYSFDFAENHKYFKSHSDIVVEVTSDVVRVVGGNVGNTVSIERYRGNDDIQEYELDSDGYLRDGQSIIAVLKNRASDVA